MFGVSVDSVDKNCAFAEKFHFNFPLLCDTEKELALAYGAMESAQDEYAQRYTFVVSPEGKVEQAIATTDPAGQAEALLDSLPESD